MKNINELPIFCDNCATLALAELDDAPLCERCLLEAVRRSEDREFALKITPLQFKEPKTLSQSFSLHGSPFAA